MNGKLKYGLAAISDYAPKWMVNSSSVVALLIASKHLLINGMPLDEPMLKSMILKWVNYGLEVVQVLLALAVVFVSKKSEHDTK